MLQITRVIQKTRPENPRERIVNQTLKEIMDIITEAQDEAYKSMVVKENYRDAVLVSMGMLEMLKRYEDINEKDYKHIAVLCKRLIRRQEAITA